MSFAMGKHLEYAVFPPSSNGDVVIQRHIPDNQGNVEIAAHTHTHSLFNGPRVTVI